LHAKSQLTPSQVASLFAGAAQGTQDAPHDAGLVFAAHCPLHTW
jgi:hypothetical protein